MANISSIDYEWGMTETVGGSVLDEPRSGVVRVGKSLHHLHHITAGQSTYDPSDACGNRVGGILHHGHTTQITVAFGRRWCGAEAQEWVWSSPETCGDSDFRSVRAARNSALS